MNNDNENIQVTPMTSETNEDQTSSAPKLRSILRKNLENKISINASSDIQQTSIEILENERDSDYTGDEEEEEENDENHISIKKESQTNEQCYHHVSNNPLEIRKTRTEKRDSIINDQSSNRPAYVTFTNDQPKIIRRSSSIPPLGGFNIEQRPSITLLNMKNNSPVTTTTTAITSDFRPVYVSPLKYRPLLGLSANDSRLLLEKRVSLLGKPLVFHPIQKRSLSYRRTQLRIYNFLERADGYKAVIYHTFV